MQHKKASVSSKRTTKLSPVSQSPSSLDAFQQYFGRQDASLTPRKKKVRPIEQRGFRDTFQQEFYPMEPPKQQKQQLLKQEQKQELLKQQSLKQEQKKQLLKQEQKKQLLKQEPRLFFFSGSGGLNPFHGGSARGMSTLFR